VQSEESEQERAAITNGQYIAVAAAVHDVAVDENRNLKFQDVVEILSAISPNVKAG
jgi:hypothetical protein